MQDLKTSGIILLRKYEKIFSPSSNLHNHNLKTQKYKIWIKALMGNGSIL